MRQCSPWNLKNSHWRWYCWQPRKTTWWQKLLNKVFRLLYNGLMKASYLSINPWMNRLLDCCENIYTCDMTRHIWCVWDDLYMYDWFIREIWRIYIISVWHDSLIRDMPHSHELELALPRATCDMVHPKLKWTHIQIYRQGNQTCARCGLEIIYCVPTCKSLVDEHFRKLGTRMNTCQDT